MKCKLADIAEFNPKETIKKGTVAKKIAMDKLRPFCRDIPEYELAPFTGGAKFRNGDTIMARITPCLENGKTAKVNVLETGEVGFGSTEFLVFRANKNITDEDYLYYLVCSPIVRDIAIKSMIGSSGRQRVQTDVVQNIEIDLPSLGNQKRIGNLLRSLDDKIEQNNKINANLEQQAQALFKAWFVDFEPFGGKMPEDWRRGTIADLGMVVGGSTPSKSKAEYYTENGIAWITPKDLSVNKEKFIFRGENDITELGLKNCSVSIMPEGTVLFSSRAPIGYIAIAAGEVTTNQGFKSVVPNRQIGAAYVYYFLKSSLSIIEGMASGSTFKEISGSTMKQVPALIPDPKILSKFNRYCEALFAQQRIVESQNRLLSSLRDCLLPKLMLGDLFNWA